MNYDRATALTVLLSLSCTAFQSTYRLDRPEPVTETLCHRLSGRAGASTDSDGWTRCFILHERFVELRQSGSVVRIRGPFRATAVAAAVELGKLSAELGFAVEVLD